MSRHALVLTAFGSFPGVEVNPTIAVVDELRRRLEAQWPELVVLTRTLDVHFGSCWAQTAELIDALGDDVQLLGVISLGVAESSSCIRLERTAQNLRRSTRPDSSGRYMDPRGEPVWPQGPHVLTVNAPLTHWAQELVATGHDVVVSDDAGTYVCNDQLYHQLRWRDECGFDGYVGFVHIPSTQTMSCEAVADALVALLNYTLRSLNGT